MRLIANQTYFLKVIKWANFMENIFTEAHAKKRQKIQKRA